jgi:hypothetical protein
MMCSYVVLLTLFALPVATWIFVRELSPTMRPTVERDIRAGKWDAPVTWLKWSTAASPLAAAFSRPLVLAETQNKVAEPNWWWDYTAPAFLAFYVTLDTVILGTMLWLFHRRWRVWSS